MAARMASKHKASGQQYLLAQLGGLMRGLVDLAETEADTLLPGYTHLQAAQPIAFSELAPPTWSSTLSELTP